MTQPASTSDTVPWLLRSKVTPPRQLVSVIDRDNLTARLDQATQGHLIILEAPAGYGKSCLLSAWKDRRMAAGEVVCWLSVDEDDDPGIFITYLAFAAHIAGIDTASSGLLDFEFSGDKNLPQTIFRFLARLEQAEKPVHLIIDDFERLGETVRTSVISTILHRLPENVTVLVASREAVNINTVNLEHRGLVTHLDRSSLRFTHTEIMSLWKNHLTARQISRLEAKTEGWPVLIRLLLTAAEMGSFDIRHIDEISYRDNAITAYFEQRILDYVEEDIRKFLLESSVFEEITDDIISEVLGYKDSDFLERLGHLEAFLTPVEGDSPGYRLHPMMRIYLKQTFRNTCPERFHSVQRKAACWYSAKGNHIRAVKRAQETGDDDLLLSILENTGGLELWLKEGLIEFRTIDACLDNDIIERSPSMSMIRTIILMKSGKQREAHTFYEKVVARHSGRIASDETLLISSAIVRLMLAVYRGACIDKKDIERVEKIRQHSTTSNDLFSGFVLTFRCVMAHQAGRLQESIACAHEAIRFFSARNSTYGEVYIYLHLAMIHALMPQDNPDTEEFRKTRRIIRQALSDDHGIRLLSDILSIEATYENDPYDLKKAVRLKNIVTQLLRSEGWIDIYAAAFRTLLEQRFFFGDTGDALHILSLMENFAERNMMDSLIRICRAQKAVIFLLDGRPDEAKALTDETSTLASYDPQKELKYVPWRVIEAECELYLYFSAYDVMPVKTATLKKITTFRDAQLEQHNIRLATRLSALLALKDSGNALRTDLDILERYQKGGHFLRSTLFVDDALIRRLKTGELASLYPGLAQTLKRQVTARTKKIKRRRNYSIITEQERAVLTELHKGHADKQIARTIGVTEHAIRYHLKNIYLKLDVHNRTEAVRKADEMEMLKPPPH